MNELQKLLNHFPDKPWYWRSISSNPNITMEFINNNPDKPGAAHPYGAASEKQLCADGAAAHPFGAASEKQRWDWRSISRNPNITMKDIINNPDKPWNWNWISFNPNITIEDIINNPDKPWDWDYISMNKFNYKKLKKFKRVFKKLCIVLIFLSMYKEIKYRPGNSGYVTAHKHFNEIK